MPDDQECARPSRVPSAELIIGNGIGILNGRTVEEDFVRIGTGIVHNMRASGLLAPDSKVLDVGCGLGRLARPMVEILSEGEYHGIDVNLASIEWCRKHYFDLHNFRFYHANINSSQYNPNASELDEGYVFPFPDEMFNFVWSTSLFTHMLISGVANYLKQMSRVMVPGAACWNTFLLLDDFAESAAAASDGTTRWHMPHRVDGGRVRDRDDWASQVALDIDRVKAAYDAADLQIIDIRYGPWSGRKENIRAGGQDVVIARKR